MNHTNKPYKITFAILVLIIGVYSQAFSLETPLVSLELFNEFQYQSLDISNDGRMLAAGGGYGIVWDVETGQEISKIFGEGYIASVCFSNDGKVLLAGADDYHAHVCTPSNGAIVQTIKAATATKYTGVGYINQVLFSPDNKEFATFDYRQGWLKIWETETGTLRMNLGDGNLYPLKFHPNGKEIICWFEKKLVFVNTSTGETGQIIKDINYFVPYRNDERIAYIKNVESKDRLIVQNLTSNEIEIDSVWPETIGPRTFDVSDDLSQIALAKQESDSGKDLNRSLFSLVGMKSFYEYSSEFESKSNKTSRVDQIIQFFPDGKKLATVNGKYVNIWDIENLTTGVLDAELLNR